MNKFRAAIAVSASILIGISIWQGGTYTETKAQEEGGIVNPPSFIVRATSDLDLTQDAISSVIYELDEELRVIDGEEIVGNLSEILSFSREGVLPVLSVNTDAAADALVSYMTPVYADADVLIMSKKTEILKKVRETLIYAGGIFDYTGNVFPENYYELVSSANSSYARTVLVGADVCTHDFVYYAASRFISVWGEAETPAEEYAALAAGTHGIVTGNVGRLQSVCRETEGTVLLGTASVIGHRGQCIGNTICTENSMGAFKSAYENGATHIETDVQITTDGQLIIMHDDTLSGTTTCTKPYKVEDLTLAKIRNYTLIDGQEIPTLEDMYKYFKGKDVVLVVEIKTKNANIVPALKELTEKYGIQDQIVGISFFADQLRRMKAEMPETPTAYLDTVSPDNFATARKILNELNTNVDVNKDLLTPQFVNGTLKTHGFVTVGWTYTDDSQSVYGILDQCCEGITVNLTEIFAGAVRRLNCEEIYYVKKGEVPEVLGGKLCYYCRETRDEDCGFFIVEGSLDDSGDVAKVILYYDT